METFLHSHPIFSALPNLTFLTSETQKFKFDKFLPRALSPTQNEPKEPKRSQINSYLDHEAAVDILLEDAAYRCFGFACSDFARFFQKLTNRTKLLKSPKNCEPCIVPSMTVVVAFSSERRPLCIQKGLSAWIPVCPHQSFP